VEDILSAACTFTQIANIWATAGSEKGARLRERIESSPDRLLRAIIGTIRKPHEETIQLGRITQWTRERDARPEIRLNTIIDIADKTESSVILDACHAYTKDVISFWSTHPPNYSAAA